MRKITALLFYIFFVPYLTMAEDVTPKVSKEAKEEAKEVVVRDIKQEIAKSVNAYITDRKLYATYAVAEGNNVFLKGASGFYDVGNKKKLQVSDIMPIASATKNFTAVAILLLQDKGLLKIDDPISKHLTSNSGIWPNGKMPEWANKVTIHHLLTHSSGIVEHVGVFHPDRKKTGSQLLKDAVAFAVSKPLEYIPGSQSTYSNTGFLLLGLIIEARSGKSAADFFKKELFEPLGMNSSFLAPVDEAFKIFDGKLDAKYPIGYYSVKDDSAEDAMPNSRLKRVIAGRKINVMVYTDTACVTNVLDLIKWNIALHHGKILSEKAYEQMITPYFKAAIDIGDVESQLGYGIYITKTSDGTLYYHHEGRSYGLRSDFGYIPANDISITIMSNIVHTTSYEEVKSGKKKIYYPSQYVDIIDFRENIFNAINPPGERAKDVDDKSEEGPHQAWDKSGDNSADSSPSLKDENAAKI